MTIKSMTIDELFAGQARRLRDAGLSDHAVDKALLFIAVEFINTLVVQNAAMKAELDARAMA